MATIVTAVFPLLCIITDLPFVLPNELDIVDRFACRLMCVLSS
jgi:GTP:adenosylcobinamide-phosphate guanylyltransferase